MVLKKKSLKGLSGASFLDDVDLDVFFGELHLLHPH